MREELVEAVLRVVEEIPEGRAATYGMIARAVGTGPRVVGRIMHDCGGGVAYPVAGKRLEATCSKRLGV